MRWWGLWLIFMKMDKKQNPENSGFDSVTIMILKKLVTKAFAGDTVSVSI